MPRRTTKDSSSTPQTLSKTLPPATPNPPLSPLIQILRRDWRWASISQFLWTFGQAAGLSTWDIDLFETDLDSPEDDVLVPETVVKFLYTLTYDKTVSRNNLEFKLRDQYLARSPKQNPFGTDREPRRWIELGLGQKVDALYRVCEWQWSNPQKFRALLNDDEPTAWRVEPIGWDKDENCYWLFDDNRLWVQHPAPKPPKPPPKPKTNSKKAKQAARAKNKSAASSSTRKPQEKRAKASVEDPVEEDEPGSSATRRSGRRQPPGRAASPSLDVIQKLIAEEKGLRSTRKRTRDEASSERMRDDMESTPSKRLRDRSGRAAPTTLMTPTKTALTAASSPMSGSRSTRRTRATATEEEIWQPIPEEWLTPSKTRTSARDAKTPSHAVNGKGKGKETARLKTGLESDSDESELSELSDAEADNASSISVKKAAHAPSSELSLDPDQADSGETKGLSRESTPLSEPEVVQSDETQERNDEETTRAGSTLGQDTTMVDSETTKGSPSPVQDPAEVPEEQAETEHLEITDSTENPAVVPEKMDVDENPDDGFNGDASNTNRGSTTELVADAVEGSAPRAVEEKSVAMDDAGDVAEAVTENLGEKGAQDAEPPVAKLEQPEREAMSGELMDVELKAEAEPPKEEVVEEEEEEITDEVLLAARKALDPGFLEWECVCVTRWDWENWPEQFAGSRHPDEKAFYDHIVENTRPAVLVHLREKEIQRAKEEAVRNRKRSSRIAMRELEKEEAAKMEEVRRDLEARMQTVRDEEAREAAVEAERMAKEREREDRLKDREERLKQREEAVAQRAIEEIRAKEEAERAREIRAQKRLAGESAAGSRSGTPNGTPNKGKGKGTDAEAPVSENEEDGAAEEEEEPWELACEVCNQHGWNVDDGRNICCCESCGRWQHTECHDKLDDSKGRKRRNWTRVNFYCHDCRKRKARERHSARKSAQLALAAEAEQISPEIRLSLPREQESSPSATRSISRPVPQGNSQGLSQGQAGSSRVHPAPQDQMVRPASTSISSIRLPVSSVPQSSGEQRYPQATNGYGGYATPQRAAYSPQARPQAQQELHPTGSHAGQSRYQQPPMQMQQGPVIYRPGYAPVQTSVYGASPQGALIQSPPIAGAQQLYLQSGQPVYRHQIQPTQVQIPQAGYRPSPGQKGNVLTPSHQQLAHSPGPPGPRHVQASPTPQAVYAVPSPRSLPYAPHGQAYQPAPPPATSDARFSQGANGPLPYQQTARPTSNGQSVQVRPMYGGYVQHQGDSKAYTQQQPRPALDARVQPPSSHGPPSVPPPSR